MSYIILNIMVNIHNFSCVYQGGGTGGSIRDAGGSFGKMEAAHEDQYFRKLVSKKKPKQKNIFWGRGSDAALRLGTKPALYLSARAKWKNRLDIYFFSLIFFLSFTHFCLAWTEFSKRLCDHSFCTQYVVCMYVYVPYCI